MNGLEHLQRFDIAEKFRLPCPQLDERFYPRYEILSKKNGISLNKHKVQYFTKDKKPIDVEEVIPIQSALESECDLVLNGLKKQEVCTILNSVVVSLKC